MALEGGQIQNLATLVIETGKAGGGVPRPDSWIHSPDMRSVGLVRFEGVRKSYPNQFRQSLNTLPVDLKIGATPQGVRPVSIPDCTAGWNSKWVGEQHAAAHLESLVQSTPQKILNHLKKQAHSSPTGKVGGQGSPRHNRLQSGLGICDNWGFHDYRFRDDPRHCMGQCPLYYHSGLYSAGPEHQPGCGGTNLGNHRGRFQCALNRRTTGRQNIQSHRNLEFWLL